MQNVDIKHPNQKKNMTNKYWRWTYILIKIMFYNKPVANLTENKQCSQAIQILLNWDLFPNISLLYTISPNIWGDNYLNKYLKLSSNNLHHPKLHHSLHISSHHRHQYSFFGGFLFFLFDFFRCFFLF